MPQIPPTPVPYQKNEIDLKEFFQTLWINKNMIIVITAIITLLALIYVFIKTPIYQATAVIEIGSYRLNNSDNNSNNNSDNNNDMVTIDNVAALSKKMNVLFIDLYKNKKNRDFNVTSISIPTTSVSKKKMVIKNNAFIEIKVEAITNKIAISGVKKIVNYVQQQHQLILNDVKTRHKTGIKHITTTINNLEDTDEQITAKKIDIKQKSLNDYQTQLNTISKNIKKIEKTNQILTVLSLIEKLQLSTLVAKIKIQLIDLQNKKHTLKTDYINNLIDKRELLKSMLLPHNYKNTEVVGAIIINDDPIKPKKILIIVLAFMSGLMSSIFLVLTITFLKLNNTTS